MGNKLGACGCSRDALGYADSPYSKQMSKNLVRFWAEVYLLAQEGKSPTTKWQMVVPKLVPVNLARVQDAPVVVAHITAYNTKVDKVMDTLVYHPGVEIFRGADCFVYWCDPQNGLTWGLNFITSEDATYFVDIIYGRTKGVLCRRANSTQSLVTKQKQNQPQRPTSIPTTPEKQRAGGAQRKQTVTFADMPITIDARNAIVPASPKPCPVHGFKTEDETFKSSPQSWPNKQLSMSNHDPCVSPTCVRSSSSNTGFYDNLANYWEKDKCDEVWQKQETEAIETVDPTKTLHISLDNNQLKKLVEPPLATSSPNLMAPSVGTSFCPKHGMYANFVPPSPKLPEPSAVTSPQKNVLAENPPPSCNSYSKPESFADTRRKSDASNSTVSFDKDPVSCDVVLRQNDRQVNVISTPMMKRSSIHLLATNSPNTLKLHEAAVKASEVVMVDFNRDLSEDNNSLNSTEESTTSQQSVNAKDQQQQQMTVPPASSQKVKKAGYVLMKQWLQLHNTNIVSLVTNEMWKRYWCAVNGVSVHFYSVVPLADSSTVAHKEEPRLSDNSELTVALYQCLAQPVPEYPRREHVFCLTNGNGESYLLQVSSESELDSWIQTLHTSAAMVLARSNSRDVVLKTLRREIDKLEQKIEMVAKMIKLSQEPSVSNLPPHQLDDWEDELELLHIQNYMTKCYSAVLRGQDCPSCKKLLAAATKTTKERLSHLGAFTSSSMHAYVLAKSNAKFHRRLSSSPSKSENEGKSSPTVEATPKTYKSHASLVQIALPNQQIIVVRVGDMDTVAAVVQKACEKASLKADKCFMLLRRLKSPAEFYVPNDDDVLQAKTANHQVELRERLVYHVHLCRSETRDNVFGLTVRAVKALNVNSIQVTVSNVDDNGLAKRAGLIVGDELLAINGQRVRRLTSLQVEQIMPECETLCMVIRTKRLALPAWLETIAYNEHDEQFVLPCKGAGYAPKLILPHADASQEDAVVVASASAENEEDEEWFSDSCTFLQNKVKYRSNCRHPSLVTRGRQRHSLPVIPARRPMSPSPQRDSFSAHSSPQQINHFEQRSSADTGLLMKRLTNDIELITSPVGSTDALKKAASNGKLAPNEKLERIIYELIETERAYVQDIEDLLRNYLEPLATEVYIPADDLHRLTSACASILKFQKGFLDELQEATDAGTSDTKQQLCYTNSSLLRNALLRLGGVFLNSAASFKVYSSFCASYLSVQKHLRNEEQNEAFQRFLLMCNVKKQHSATLASYLIKPVQRVLRYPLFLQQIKTLTSGAAECFQIGEALTKMEKVAEYINEMQRVYEEYGFVFSYAQGLVKCSARSDRLNFDVCELLMLGEVDWLNAVEDVRKKSSVVPTECLCFVFKSAVLLVAYDYKKNKKTKGNNCVEKLSICRIIPVAELEVNGSDVGSSDGRFLWIVIHMDPSVTTSDKIYYFASRRLEVKQQFLKAIRKAGILTAKLNQQLRLNSPSSPGFHVNHLSSSSTVSSPDSGLPQRAALALPHREQFSIQNSTFGVNNVVNDLKVNIDFSQRPVSYHSSQSDHGYYGSNGELQRKL